MTVEEVYKAIAAHMVEGVMFHGEMANYYDFLGLRGYKRCHEYHFYCESKNFRCLNRYFINHHSKLIEEEKVDQPSVIPESWFRYKREDVSPTDIRNAVKTGVEKWVAWERETKKLYEDIYAELMNSGAVASAKHVMCYICDVDRELKKAERHWLKLKMSDYDLGAILAEQDHLHDKYLRKMK